MPHKSRVDLIGNTQVFCCINDGFIKTINGSGSDKKMFGDLRDVSIQPNTEIRSLFEDLFNKLLTGHAAKIRTMIYLI
jgi:hypothetical protein